MASTEPLYRGRDKSSDVICYTRDVMADTQFDAVMEKGLTQAKTDDSKSVNDFLLY